MKKSVRVLYLFTAEVISKQQMKQAATPYPQRKKLVILPLTMATANEKRRDIVSQASSLPPLHMFAKKTILGLGEKNI